MKNLLKTVLMVLTAFSSAAHAFIYLENRTPQYIFFAEYHPDSEFPQTGIASPGEKRLISTSQLTNLEVNYADSFDIVGHKGSIFLPAALLQQINNLKPLTVSEQLEEKIQQGKLVISNDPKTNMLVFSLVR
jgi:hypothetical protein